MTARCPAEITAAGVWSPDGTKKLKWGNDTLKSVISADCPGGHILLDYIVRAAMPWMDKELEEHVSKQESLFYEDIKMRIKKGSNKVILEDANTEERAHIDKDVLLKLIGNLRKDFLGSSRSTRSLRSYAAIGEKEPSTEYEDLPTDANKRKLNQHMMEGTKSRTTQKSPKRGMVNNGDEEDGNTSKQTKIQKRMTRQNGLQNHVAVSGPHLRPK